MKNIFIVGLLLGFAISAAAVDQAQLDDRIRELTGRFGALQEKAEKRIPADKLREAKGIVLLDCTKGGLMIGYQSGRGLAMTKDLTTGQWGAPAFLKSGETSFGLQLGGQRTFVVMLLMNTNATRILTDAEIDFGGEARGTAGRTSVGTEGQMTPIERAVLVYDDRGGFYGGVAIKGGTISADAPANRAYYNRTLSLTEILMEKKVKPSASATALDERIAQYSKQGPTDKPAGSKP